MINSLGFMEDLDKLGDSEQDDEESVEPAEDYDPTNDDEDEQWANKQRQGRKSDAILSCPACFTTLCIDCQRHEKFETQYRAMFVRNCKVLKDEVYLNPTPTLSTRSMKRKRNISAAAAAEKSILRPVKCGVCDVLVGVFDEDEVYHFFDTIASYA